MILQISAIGTKLPRWINEGVSEYTKRFSRECRLQLEALPAVKRHNLHDAAKYKQQETDALLSSVPQGSYVVVLDVKGEAWSTEKLAEHLAAWLQHQTHISFLIGGADGLAENALSRAQKVWSLSALTLPHGLVRILVVEQLYRAWSLINHHPYHREG